MPWTGSRQLLGGYYLDRRPAGAPDLELRTPGLLLRSNKLMYDERSESLLDQFSGQALIGPLRAAAGTLQRFTVLMTAWQEWRTA
ncbi:MAG: DUF3179 domain-containing (seleno)protein [Geodermatophilaceae bacterium]